MKKPALVLLVLLSLLSLAPSTAQMPPVEVSASHPAATPAPVSVAQFLATLSATLSVKQAQIPNDLAPAPSFLTGCTDNSQCPTGQLCCYLCGNPPDGDDSGCRACVWPVKRGCPLVY